MNNVSRYSGTAQQLVDPVTSLMLITHHGIMVVDRLFSKLLIHSLSCKCSSLTRQLLVDMALRISSTNVGGQRRIHVVKYTPDTSSMSGLMCGLVPWVIVWQVHVFSLNVTQAASTVIYS